jgi:hypothetical protein
LYQRVAILIIFAVEITIHWLLFSDLALKSVIVNNARIAGSELEIGVQKNIGIEYLTIS